MITMKDLPRKIEACANETRFNFNSNGINVTIVKDKNYTLTELRQKLINELYKMPITSYETKDFEILKILFENNDRKSKISTNDECIKIIYGNTEVVQTKDKLIGEIKGKRLDIASI